MKENTARPIMLKEIPPEIRPRERLFQYGARALSDQELLAILLRTGTKSQSVMELALSVLRHFESLHEVKMATLEELQSIKGLGKVKAAELKAALELGARLQEARQLKHGQVFSSEMIGYQMVAELKDIPQEVLVVIYLNTKNEVIKKRTVFQGSLNQSVAHPREIFRGAVRCSAARIILVHNHRETRSLVKS